MGKYHNIEVEDEVTAYFEHDRGMIGQFITSTAEAPGNNRLEILGDFGKLIWENGSIIFYRNRGSLLDDIRESSSAFNKPETWVCGIPREQTCGEHRLLLTISAGQSGENQGLLWKQTKA